MYEFKIELCDGFSAAAVAVAVAPVVSTKPLWLRPQPTK